MQGVLRLWYLQPLQMKSRMQEGLQSAATANTSSTAKSAGAQQYAATANSSGTARSAEARQSSATVNKSRVARRQPASMPAAPEREVPAQASAGEAAAVSEAAGTG